MGSCFFKTVDQLINSIFWEITLRKPLDEKRKNKLKLLTKHIIMHSLLSSTNGVLLLKSKHKVGGHWNKGKPLSLCSLISRAKPLRFPIPILESRFWVGIKKFKSSPLSKEPAKSSTSCSKHLPSSEWLQSLSRFLEQQACSSVVLARYELNTPSVASCSVSRWRRCLRSRRQSTLQTFCKRQKCSM